MKTSIEIENEEPVDFKKKNIKEFIKQNSIDFSVGKRENVFV